MNSGYKRAIKRYPELGRPLRYSLQNETEYTDFIEPQVDDCSKCQGSIAECIIIQRIIHLLAYFNKNQRNIPGLYQYISSLNNYTVSTFMEDWYHSKTKHFKTR
eukprot:101239_1